VLVGALTVAVLPTLPSTVIQWADEPALLPFLLAVPCGILQIGAVIFLIQEPPRSRGTRALLRTIRNCPAVAWDSLRLSSRRGDLRLLLIAGLGIGVAIGAVETFWQPEFARILDNSSRATTMVGLLVVAATVAGAIGSALAARLPSLLTRRTDLICAGLLLLIGLAIVGMATAPSVSLTAACFVGVYFLLELRAPLGQTLLHRACPPGRRASVLSAYSMSTNACAVAASLGLGTVLGTHGASAIWLVAAATVALTSIAYLRLQPGGDGRANVTSRTKATATG
jgi:predicted MFS family arabinose efflux permease